MTIKMKTANILNINIKKLKTRPKKAMFLIIPVLVLVTLSVTISSQIQNIQSALEDTVFDTIAAQYTLLKVKTEEESFDPANMFSDNSSFEQNRFSETDISNMESIEGVESASLQSVLPIQNLSTSDLFEDKEVELTNISTLDASTASLYTTEDFSYTEGQPIPIILSANSLTYTYEDWSGGETQTITMERPDENTSPQQGGGMRRISIEKTEAISYTKDDLIGKTFTISFGGLEEIRDYTTTMDRETRTMTITKLSEAEYTTKVEERKASIATYWNYDTLSTPITRSFIIVGIDESEDATSNYIPEDSANVLMKEYLSKEINARLSTEIPTDILNTDFMGMTYNGDEITYSGFGGVISQFGGRIRERMGQPGGEPGEEPEDISFSAITIPGLVIDIDDDTNAVNGVISDPDLYSTSTKYTDTVNIILGSITQRTEVIKSLNKAGYAYQDLGDLEVFENLESTLKTISNIFLASFVLLVASVVILTMGKVVSESTREIGIFRAIGMRKKDILVMFVSQSLLYVFIGYAIGILCGIVVNLLISGIISSWFNSFINKTISQTFDVVNSVDSVIFRTISWDSILIYTILLFIISLIISIIPSLNASRISPVEAIKNE